MHTFFVLAITNVLPLSIRDRSTIMHTLTHARKGKLEYYYYCPSRSRLEKVTYNFIVKLRRFFLPPAKCEILCLSEREYITLVAYSRTYTTKGHQGFPNVAYSAASSVENQKKKTSGGKCLAENRYYRG